MTPGDQWSLVEGRLSALGENRWEMVTDSNGQGVIRLNTADNQGLVLRVTRESEPAAIGDIRFISHAPSDLRRLLEHVRGKRECTVEELDEIKQRVASASSSPWKAFLKSKGGVGGDSVIWVSEDDREPDLYLWIGADPAPDAYFDFVASARQDLPVLLGVAAGG
jgi:hypothetical protein